MRRAIVHVGMPRTASTTIQHVLAHRRAVLASRGILYPELTPRAAAGLEPHISHQYLGEALDGRRPRAEERELLDALSGQLRHSEADVVVLSYEDWIQEKRAPAIAATLRDTLARCGFRMEAVMVVKPQDEHVNSVYAHRTQLMREKQFFAPFAARFQLSRRLDYAALLQPWLAACDGRVVAVPLRDARSDAPLIGRFLSALGLSDRILPLLPDGEGSRVENRSPGPVAAEVSRRLRLLRVPSRLPLRPRAAMRVIEAEAALRNFDAVPFKGVDPVMRNGMVDRFAATNARFARAVWGQGWDEVVRPDRVFEPNEIGGHPAPPRTEAAINEIMRVAGSTWNLSLRAPWYARAAELGQDMADHAARFPWFSRWRVV